jgi:DNA-binding transcriptional ArsR family regulator
MHEGLNDFDMPTEAQVAVATDAFRPLAEPTRIKLVWALLQGESSVLCLADLVGASPTAVYQHLSKLRWAKLVQVRREGTFAYYSAADDHVARLLAEALYHADHQVLSLLDHPTDRPRLHDDAARVRIEVMHGGGESPFPCRRSGAWSVRYARGCRHPGDRMPVGGCGDHRFLPASPPGPATPMNGRGGHNGGD